MVRSTECQFSQLLKKRGLLFQGLEWIEVYTPAKIQFGGDMAQFEFVFWNSRFNFEPIWGIDYNG